MIYLCSPNSGFQASDSGSGFYATDMEDRDSPQFFDIIGKKIRKPGS
jgi:hypothetical protein